MRAILAGVCLLLGFLIGARAQENLRLIRPSEVIAEYAEGTIQVDSGERYWLCRERPGKQERDSLLWSRGFCRCVPYWGRVYRYGTGIDSTDYLLSVEHEIELDVMNYEIIDTVAVPALYVILDDRKWGVYGEVYPAW